MIQILQTLLTGEKLLSLVCLIVVMALPLSRAIATPVITVDASYIELFALDEDQEEQLQFYTVTFSNILPGESAYITLHDPTGTFSISMDGGNTFSNSLVIAPTGGTHEATSADVSVTVRYLRNQEKPYTTATITHSTTSATPKNVPIEGIVVTPFPVRLLSFKASAQQNAVILTWKAAADADLSHFELETADGEKLDFKTVAVVNYSGKEDEYQYVYTPRNTGGVQYFRLAQTYYQHNTLYSSIIAVKTKTITETRVTVSPNPVQPASQLTVTAAVAGKMKLILHDGSGTEVFAKVVNVTGGENYFDIDSVQQLRNGLYFLTTELNGEINRLKLLKL